MLLEGHIYLFTPFYFKNSKDFKDKFFIILKNIDGKSIIASLPTSSNKAPSLIDLNHGCVNIDERKFNCYVFENKRIICENGFCFKLNTYVYGDQIKDYELSTITKNNSIVIGKDYDLMGKLNDSEFKSLIDCIVKSNSIIRKYKKVLSGN